MMTKTVRHTFHTIGDRGGDIAKALGSGTADVAVRFGRGTAGLARRIGPRRSLVGLAMLAATIGGTVVLIRYLRARNAERLSMEASNPDATESTQSRKRARAQNAANAMAQH